MLENGKRSDRARDREEAISANDTISSSFCRFDLDNVLVAAIGETDMRGKMMNELAEPVYSKHANMRGQQRGLKRDTTPQGLLPLYICLFLSSIVGLPVLPA